MRVNVTPLDNKSHEYECDRLVPRFLEKLRPSRALCNPIRDESCRFTKRRLIFLLNSYQFYYASITQTITSYECSTRPINCVIVRRLLAGSPISPVHCTDRLANSRTLLKSPGESIDYSRAAKRASRDIYMRV